MASKFYVSPRLFAQILPLQLPALKSCGRRLAAVDRISLSEARSAPSATPRRLSVTHRCTADISWRGAPLQWQDLGKISKANAKLWRLRDDSGNGNPKNYSTRAHPLDQNILIFQGKSSINLGPQHLLPVTPSSVSKIEQKQKITKLRKLSWAK